jgi:hypothetical protein
MHVYKIYTAKAFDMNNANNPYSLYANLIIKCYEVIRFEAFMEVTVTITDF